MSKDDIKQEILFLESDIRDHKRNLKEATEEAEIIYRKSSIWCNKYDLKKCKKKLDKHNIT